MARIPDGILGPFLGKAGPVSGYMRNGNNFIRTSTRRKDNSYTPARIGQQHKIKVCTLFTKAFSGAGFFNKSFPAYGNRGTGYNRATSALMKLAIVGNYPNINIAYSLALISRGLLPSAENVSATVNPDGNIFFSWINNSGNGTAKANDKVILVAFFPSENQAIYLLDAAVRANCQAVLQTHIMKGYAAETWIGFLSNDEKDASNSVYTGRIDL